MKDHEIRELVNTLTEIAKKYHGAQQLRAQIAEVVVPLLQKRQQQPVAYLRVLPATDEAGERTIIERRLSVMNKAWKCYPLLKGEEQSVPVAEDVYWHSAWNKTTPEAV